MADRFVALSTVSFAMDHRGICLRPILLDFFQRNGLSAIDRGTRNGNPVDYPLYAQMVARDIVQKRASFAVLVCATGIGMAMAANRFRGVRAAVAVSAEMAELSRRHGHANVLCLGTRWQADGEVYEILDSFFSSPAEGGRHARRVRLLDAEGVDLEELAAQ
jgi:ribose 5-phosphate isomerase B